MALKIYDTLAPQGNYPAAQSEDVEVIIPTNESFDATGTDGNLMRMSCQVGDIISRGDYDAYRINSLAFRAAAGTAVRFALYEVDAENGVLTQLDVLGDAVADSDAQVATLSINGGYRVTQASTIILAFAREAALHCQHLDATIKAVQFADGDYYDNANGAQIAYSDETTDATDSVSFAMFARDIDFLIQKRLDQYLKETGAQLAEVAEKAENALPAVTAADNGKFLRVDGGVWAACTVDNAEGVSF